MEAATRWAKQIAAAHPEVRRVGLFGSYAAGTWGVGSDVDLVVLVDGSARPFRERPLDFDCSALPVPADVLVYTEVEWDKLQRESLSREGALGQVAWLVTPPG